MFLMSLQAYDIWLIEVIRFCFENICKELKYFYLHLSVLDQRYITFQSGIPLHCQGLDQTLILHLLEAIVAIKLKIDS
jgi:hypothetical protein